MELFAVRVRPNDIGIKVASGIKNLVSEYWDVFGDELPNELPPRRKLDFENNLQSDQPPPDQPVI